MRLKADNVDEDPDGGDGDVAVDPRKLRSWAGLGVTHVMNANGREPKPDNAAVAWCFQQAMPMGAKLTMSMDFSGTAEKALEPFAQWVYSLFHIVINWESGMVEGWLLAHHSRGQGRDRQHHHRFLDTARECPPYVPAVQPSLPRRRDARCGVARRFCHSLPQQRKHQDFDARLKAFGATIQNNPGRCMRASRWAASPAWARCAPKPRRDRVRAEPACQRGDALGQVPSWFYSVSPQHGEASGVRPFLVPPKEPAGRSRSGLPAVIVSKWTSSRSAMVRQPLLEGAS